jgi:antitoxin VapB
MAILIKNPETERKARELASLRGVSLTGAIDGALDKALAEAAPPRRKPTLQEMHEATERFRARAGIVGPQPPVTKEEWDEINEVPGFSEDCD